MVDNTGGQFFEGASATSTALLNQLEDHKRIRACLLQLRHLYTVAGYNVPAQTLNEKIDFISNLIKEFEKEAAK